MNLSDRRKQFDMTADLRLTAFSSEDSAIKVNSVEEEYILLAQHALIHFGLRNAFPFRQKLTVREQQAFDTLYLNLPDGSVREYWFDISIFFGH
jgi:hypothetical protein